jgi:hypothetical protein
MRSIIFVFGVVLLFFIAVEIEIEAAEAEQGKQLYIQYCGSCHGKDGRGNGSVSPYLKIAVPDLTMVKKNNKGIYPLDNVMATIDGRRAVRTHGDRAICLSGEKFSERKQNKESTPSLPRSSKPKSLRSMLPHYKDRANAGLRWS